jgi:hypothetical protein
MALPQQLKSARMTDATIVSAVDNHVGDIEGAICDILGITINSDVTESHFLLNNAGQITKALIRQAAAPPVGWRFRDTTNGKEFRLVINNTSVLIDENTGTEPSPVWTNRLTIAIGTGLPTLAGATDPSNANDLARKGYVDAQVAGVAGFPAGTKMVFFQAAAPSGWTKDVTHNDKMLRVVSGSGGGSGGNWTISGLTVGGTALTIAQMPAHTHTYNRIDGSTYVVGSGAYAKVTNIYSGDTGSTGSGATHTHSISANGAWRPLYIDVIVCTKN